MRYQLTIIAKYGQKEVFRCSMDDGGDGLRLLSEFKSQVLSGPIPGAYGNVSAERLRDFIFGMYPGAMLKSEVVPLPDETELEKAQDYYASARRAFLQNPTPAGSTAMNQAARALRRAEKEAEAKGQEL